jgi:hypothetical protein
VAALCMPSTLTIKLTKHHFYGHPGLAATTAHRSCCAMLQLLLLLLHPSYTNAAAGLL